MEKFKEEPETAIKPDEEPEIGDEEASQNEETKLQFSKRSEIKKRFDYLNEEPRPLVYEHKYNLRYRIWLPAF